jgi:uroporphyrinogen decarboxylase
VEDVKSYRWPEARIDEKLMAKWRGKAKRLKEDGKYVVIAEHPYFGILELGMWLCGYDGFMINMALNPDVVKTFFEIVTNIQLTVAEQYYGELRPYIDLTTSGDDFGTQRAPMISAGMFDELIGLSLRRG